MAENDAPIISFLDWVELNRTDVMAELVRQDRPPVLVKGTLPPSASIGNRGMDVVYCYVPPELSTLFDRPEGPPGGVKKFISPTGKEIGESKPLVLTPNQAELIRERRRRACREYAIGKREGRLSAEGSSRPFQTNYRRGAW